ncbi:MAG: DsbE family thiol:disulfide interchange protein [Candidatus Rickettsiella isopodorum]|jgi:cytochrome c biogenesis protein CcmG, thiol:disulfide interchange protein DsbE|nr:DsbE family thiol:disulfide interchange protein [Gammaproteobacteria bacterium]
MRYIIPLIILLIIVCFLWQGLEKDPNHLPSPLINQPISEFSANDLLKKSITLRKKIFLQHWTLLVVWSSWCLTCAEEQSFLLSLKKNHAISIYGLNYRDEFNQAKQWLRQQGNPFQKIIFDPQGLLAIDLGVYGVPESYLIDPQGIIRYKQVGPLTSSIWIQNMQPLIKHLHKGQS